MGITRHTGEESKQLVRRFWEQAFNKGNADIVDEFVSAEFLLRDLATGNEMNRDQVKDLIAGVQSHIDEPSVTVQDQWIADQDCVVSQLTLRARPKGSDDKSDEWAELNAVAIDRVSNGRVVESRLMWDAWTADQKLRPLYRWRFPWW